MTKGNEKNKSTKAAVKHKRRYCRIDGCERIVKSQGLCQRHGAKCRLCTYPGCSKQAQGNFDKMCKAHFKETKTQLIARPSDYCSTQTSPAQGGNSKNKSKIMMRPTSPQGESVYDKIIPDSLLMSNVSSNSQDLPLIKHLRQGFDQQRPRGWHRNDERRARGLQPIFSPSIQLEGWERELVWLEICLLTGNPSSSFRHLARAWGRDKGFHMVLAQFICGRRGNVERKKRLASSDNLRLKKAATKRTARQPTEFAPDGNASKMNTIANANINVLGNNNTNTNDLLSDDASECGFQSQQQFLELDAYELDMLEVLDGTNTTAAAVAVAAAAPGRGMAADSSYAVSATTQQQHQHQHQHYPVATAVMPSPVRYSPNRRGKRRPTEFDPTAESPEASIMVMEPSPIPPPPQIGPSPQHHQPRLQQQQQQQQQRQLAPVAPRQLHSVATMPLSPQRLQQNQHQALPLQQPQLQQQQQQQQQSHQIIAVPTQQHIHHLPMPPISYRPSYPSAPPATAEHHPSNVATSMRYPVSLEQQQQQQQQQQRGGAMMITHEDLLCEERPPMEQQQQQHQQHALPTAPTTGQYHSRAPPGDNTPGTNNRSVAPMQAV